MSNEKMYQCGNCGAIFLEEDMATDREYHTEVAEFGIIPYEEFGVCPSCGCDDLVEVYECEICGSLTENWWGICDTCDEQETEDD